MISLDGRSLTLEQFESAVIDGETCALDERARSQLLPACELIAEVFEKGATVYGVNTGFGDLASVSIPLEQTRELQRNLLLSHAVGVGELLSSDTVRGMLLLRANTLACGHSGVRPELVDLLLALLNRNLLPVIPSRGSVGASGDLAPLAHLVLPLIGEGRVEVDGETVSGAEALAANGLASLRLEPKEGLALINGTQAMTALLALATLEAQRLVKASDLIGALTTDAMRGTDTAFDARLHQLRPFPGQLASARNLWNLLQGSSIRESHRLDDSRVQDPYSIRCMPQVHGAARDLVSDVAAKLAIELNAVTDNPLLFPEDGEILSGGNFHGEPMAMAADILAIGLAELGSISERRIEKMMNQGFSGLPAFLTKWPGVNSGFMMTQVTAAALVAENRLLAHPASVDSIPTSADREDHVSMGMGAALKLQTVVGNLRFILAIELLAACQGIDLLRPMTSSNALEELHVAVRKMVASLEEDREMSADIQALDRFLRSDIDHHLASLE
jgi:histidine ammonia-lyase